MLSLILGGIALLAIASIIWLVISDRIAIRRQEAEDQAKAEQDRRDREYDAQRAAFRAKRAVEPFGLSAHAHTPVVPNRPERQAPRSAAPTAKAAAAQSKRESDLL